jgi:hypothetical protein
LTSDGDDDHDHDHDEEDKENVQFWIEDPNILLNPKHVFELFPTEEMTYNQKLNSITRTVILAVVSFIATKNYRLIIVSVITLAALWIVKKTILHGKSKW